MNAHPTTPTTPAATSPRTAEDDAGFSVRDAGAITTAGAGAAACARAISELTRVGDPGPQGAVGPATVILRELAAALDAAVPPTPTAAMGDAPRVHATCLLAVAAADTLTTAPTNPPSAGTWAGARALALAAIDTWVRRP